MRRIGFAIAIFIAVMPLGPARAAALPDTPPQVTISAPELVYAGSLLDVSATGNDGDGFVTVVTLCAGDDPCSDSDTQPSTIETVTACLTGTSLTTRLRTRASAPGTLHLTARVESLSCPTGATIESAEDSADVLVVDPPSLAVPCADEGTPTATDTGVTDTTISIGATITATGFQSSYLRDAADGIEAARRAINAAGGVCGRQIDIRYVDDGGDPQRGKTFLTNLAEEGAFALMAASPEGLHAAINDGSVDALGVPVVGTDGTTASQFRDPLVWPVGTSAASQMHVIAQNAYDAGARSIGLVYTTTFHAGIDALAGMQGAAQRLGMTLETKGVDVFDSDFTAAVSEFRSRCGCDAVVMALDEPSAIKWMMTSAAQDYSVTDAWSGLFTLNFAQACGSACDGLRVWNDARPPIGPFVNDPLIAYYSNLVHSVDPSADTYNSFVESAYTGMLLLANAMGRAGHTLTRAALQDALDHMTLNAGTMPSLSWTAGNHEANLHVQAFTVRYTGSFSGWSVGPEATDPWPGTDL